MCNVSVQVVEVDDDQLPVPWVAGRADDGRRVLFVRRSATPAQVAAGYGAALRQCPVRIRLELVA